MTDILGYRQKIGLLIPSTNSTVQPEMDDMRPAGVTNHVSRIDVPNQTFTSNDDARAIVEATWVDLLPAVDRLMACNPDRLIMAMAVPCFWGGTSATQTLKAKLEQRAGVPVTMPPDALHEALQALGTATPIRRIGIVSPYMPLADEHVAQWFTEQGYEQVFIEGLKAHQEDAVVSVSPAAQVDTFKRLDAKGVDALLQVGTSMASAQLVVGVEAFLGKPVLAVNTACYWSALRAAGIPDKVAGFGQLLAEL
jgi:maleate isomerase